MRSDLQSLPLHFVANEGQLDAPVDYYVQGSDTSVYFTPEGVTYRLSDRESERAWAVKLDFVGANHVHPEGRAKTEATINYFKGPKMDWSSSETYSKLVYRNLWDGIDLVYKGTASELKYSFVVHPGADPSDIELAYRGADSVRLNRKGDIEVSTPVTDFSDKAPYSFQRDGGRRSTVASSYDLGQARPNGRSYGFDLGDFDDDKSLVIDPVVLIYAGYIGGSGYDIGYGIAVDSSGAAYVTGYTESTAVSFPETGGPDLDHDGGYDAFVAKVASDGSSLVYAGYIGGSGYDAGYGIAVDSSGAAYVTGYTGSTEQSFPEIGGPDVEHNGGYDAFVAKVAVNGSSLVYAGYIGGSGSEYGEDIAVDSAGAAYVTGRTGSTEATFPEIGGPDVEHNGGDDAFVAKVAANGSALVYAGYIGGAGEDRGDAIAVDSSGAAYVTGRTGSTETSFPETGGPDLQYNGGENDAFVAKVAVNGSSLVYAGYIGGSGFDGGLGIAVDSSGAAYVVGGTWSGGAFSPEDTFPATGGPDLEHNGGVEDGFVAKVAVNGSALVYAGFIGGSSDGIAIDVDVDSSGAAYVTGRTESTATSFPVADGPDLTHNGYHDAYVAKVAPDGSTFVYAGYIGGAGSQGNSGSDGGVGITVDSSGAAYITGYTASTEASFPDTGGPDISYNGGTDAFVAKVATGFTLAVARSGEGTVTSDPAGIDCGNDCSNDYQEGTAVTLTATPAEGYDFAGWSDDCTNLTGTCTVTMDQAHSVTATFELESPACDDGEDNDGDGATDEDDPGCMSAIDDDERNGPIPPVCAGASESDNVIVGTARDDLLVGTDGRDAICGGGGNDTIRGGGGRDLVDGGVEADDIAGGLGYDRIFGRRGADDARGNDGEDLLVGGPHNDVLLGSADNDLLKGNGGDDTLGGGTGRDFCSGGPGSNTFSSCEDRP